VQALASRQLDVDLEWEGLTLPVVGRLQLHLGPQTIKERRQIAGECDEALKYGIRTYVDEMDDAVNKAYAAWPTRLYLVGVDRVVAYAGGLGPFGFKPSEFAKAIETYLVNQSAYIAD